MRIEPGRPGVFQLTLHAYELSALVAAARWSAEGGTGHIPPEARDQLRRVLEAYDAEIRRLESG